jgi:CRP-like cAMP-binding protein
MNAQPPTMETLFRLQPLGSLPAERTRELAALAQCEVLPRGSDLLAHRDLGRQSVYLLEGELRLLYLNGSSDVVVGGSELCLHPLGKHGVGVRAARSITDIELVSFDDDLLDAMMTWDQLSASHEDELPDETMERTGWFSESTLMRVQSLARGLFPALPQVAIDALLSHAKRVRVGRGDAVVREGELPDYYYVIEAGRCRVSRQVGGGEIELAELGGGDAFGEDSLIEGAPRNATVTMLTDGMLLRVSRDDFLRLLRDPLLQRLSRAEADAKAASGAIWVDVRFPAEYAFDKIPGAINIPLNEIRNATRSLDPVPEYVLYCQSGKRSSAAAFLLSQHGYRAFVLDGGLRQGARERPVDAVRD